LFLDCLSTVPLLYPATWVCGNSTSKHLHLYAFIGNYTIVKDRAGSLETGSLIDAGQQAALRRRRE
jgi:hypothetical protein